MGVWRWTLGASGIITRQPRHRHAMNPFINNEFGLMENNRQPMIPIPRLKRLLLLLSVVVCPSLAGAEDPSPVKGFIHTVVWCGNFVIGTRGGDLWVYVPDMGKQYRIPPTPYGKEGGSTKDASVDAPSGIVSPDGEWVALEQGHCAHYSVGYVLQRNPRGALEPLPRLVSEMAWDKFFEEHPDEVARRGRMAGITDLVASSICDLVAWEPDSSGVWFSLSGGDRRNAGFYHWYFFWSTKTGMVTVPERVKLINRYAASRWSNGAQPLSQEAVAAEEQHYVFLAELEHRLDHPKRPVDVQALQRGAHERLIGPGTANPPRDPPTVTGQAARDIIDSQRAALFRASLKVGAVAPLNTEELQ